ncbi:hypothetical protein CC78DRAFT_244827 [Lojkania enalia]|uniref:Uncharacterized protein n=1 Tax=Lojkania enalia TaxID=147567 RepID=A0A9P4TQV0_9PLEO|nr:hypothetical protein CC78DRAFT_244827 [Didymosphaeria enalia]
MPLPPGPLPPPVTSGSGLSPLQPSAAGPTMDERTITPPNNTRSPGSRRALSHCSTEPSTSHRKHRLSTSIASLPPVTGGDGPLTRGNGGYAVQRPHCWPLTARQLHAQPRPSLQPRAQLSRASNNKKERPQQQQEPLLLLRTDYCAESKGQSRTPSTCKSSQS